MNLKNDLNIIIELCMFYFQNYFALLIGRAKVENERQGLLMQGPGHFQTNTHGECSNWINQSWWISGHGIRCYCRWKLWSKGHYARFDKLIPTGLWLFPCKRAHVCVCVCVCVWKSTLAAIGALKCNFCPFKKLWQTDQLADLQTDRPSQKEV